MVFAVFGLSSTALVRVSTLQGWVRFLTLAITISSIAGVLTLVAGAGPARRIEVKDAAGPRVCSPATIDQVAVCAWPDNRAAKAIAAEQGAMMWGSLSSRTNRISVPAGIVDQGLAAETGWVSVPLWAPDNSDIAINLSEATVIWFWCGDGIFRVDDPDGGFFARQLWLQKKVNPAAPGFHPEVERIVKMSEYEQSRWLTEKPRQATCIERQ